MSQEKEIIVGGQAVIEGVMMRAPNSYAVAVRKQDGSIVYKAEPLPKLSDKYPILKVPVLRGSAVLIHSMLLGIKALNFSATVAFEDQVEGEELKTETPLAAKAAAATGALATTAHVIEAPGQFAHAPSSSQTKPKSGSASATATAAGSMVSTRVANLRSTPSSTTRRSKALQKPNMPPRGRASAPRIASPRQLFANGAFAGSLCTVSCTTIATNVRSRVSERRPKRSRASSIVQPR